MFGINLANYREALLRRSFKIRCLLASVCRALRKSAQFFAECSQEPQPCSNLGIPCSTGAQDVSSALLCAGKAAGSGFGRCWEAGGEEFVAGGFRQGLQAAGKEPKMLIQCLLSARHESHSNPKPCHCSLLKSHPGRAGGKLPNVLNHIYSICKGKCFLPNK